MIIQRYIYRELLSKLVWILGLLILVFTSNRFVGFLADAAEGSIPGDLVFQMLAYKMLGTLPKIFPVAILVAMLLGFARMANDRELVVMLAAGISRRFQLQVVTRFAAAFCVVVAITTLYLAPWAEQQLSNLKEVAKQRADIAGIRPGQFKEFSKGERIVYVQRSSEDKLAMEDVFLHVKQDSGKQRDMKSGVLTAASARFRDEKGSGNRYIEFSNGNRYVMAPGQLDYQIIEFETYALLTEDAQISESGLKTDALSTSTLVNSDNKVHKAELQWRISMIIACLMLPWLGVLLIQTHTREERRYGPFVIAISIYLIYSNLLGISQTLIRRDLLPVFIGLWWVHLLLAGVLFLFYYLPRNKRRAASGNAVVNNGID